MIFLLVLFVTQSAYAALNCPESGTPTTTSTASGPVCAGGSLHLQCPPGKLIRIVYATWGREDNFSCNYTSTDRIDCKSPNSTIIASNECNDECSCTLQANSSMFGDPCPGTNKYLVVLWECIEILECCRCEEFSVVASTCEPHCDPQKQIPCVIRPGCQCKSGYLRDWLSGRCVKKCPFYSPKNPNCTTDEELDLCGPGCEYTCQNPKPKCYNHDCLPGYFCVKPLLRNEVTGLCVPKEDCPCYCHGYDSISSSSSSSSSEECP